MTGATVGTVAKASPVTRFAKSMAYTEARPHRDALWLINLRVLHMVGGSLFRVVLGVTNMFEQQGENECPDHHNYRDSGGTLVLGVVGGTRSATGDEFKRVI